MEAVFHFTIGTGRFHPSMLLAAIPPAETNLSEDTAEQSLEAAHDKSVR